MDVLLAPGAPAYAISVAGALLAAYGLGRKARVQQALRGVRTVPDRWGQRGRVLVGMVCALPIAVVLVVLAQASGAQGAGRWLVLVVALAVVLAVGVVLPRRPLVQLQRERRQLRRLTPGFVSYVRVALAGFDAPAILLERYINRPEPALALLQALVAEALAVMTIQRLRPFAALRVVAHMRGCHELIVVTDALAQAEADGSDVQAVLAAHAQTLEAVLEDEFRRMVERRKLYLIGLGAFSVLLGVLGNVLFIMTGGGSVFARIGG